MSHHEIHRVHRIGWLRAAVLGANDGIVSTASLIIGVAAANAQQSTIVVAGMAGLVAGAMSMAAGEYVSVSSQADTETADLALEAESIRKDFAMEQRELANIYRERGLDEALSNQVSQQLMEHDPLEAHARDELGIHSNVKAQPIQAAFSSAAAFAIGAALPLSAVIFAPPAHIITTVATLTLLCLVLLGALAAKTGGASVLKGATRVTFWGMLAMAVTAMVGNLFGVNV